MNIAHPFIEKPQVGGIGHHDFYEPLPNKNTIFLGTGRNEIMDLVDLHIHSLYSDGTCSPKELILMARENKLKAVALTDHDTLEGTEEMARHGSNLGMEIIPGVELSAWHGDTSMHLLGYWIDTRSRELVEGLREMQEIRRRRNRGIIEKLNVLGIDTRYEDIRRFTPGQIGRPHFARLLVSQGIVSSENHAYGRFLRKGGAAYVEKERFPASRAISMIRNAGGVPVLAHPGTMDPSLKSIPKLLDKLKNIGLLGVEVYSSAHTKSITAKIHGMAEDLDLFITGGSDFHGGLKPYAPMGGSRGGVKVPLSVIDPMKTYLDVAKREKEPFSTDGSVRESAQCLS